jgi:hypothetical protein
MTKQEACEVIEKEMEEGGIDNPSHGITQENVSQYLVDPERITMEMEEGDNIYGWKVFDMGEYVVAIDEEYGNFDFVYSYGDGRYGYIGSFETLVEAINGI